jgi:hypothetical protein
MSSRGRKTVKASKRHEKRQSQVKWQGRDRKSLEEQEKLKIKAKAQNQHKSSKSTLPLKSTPPSTLNASFPLRQSFIIFLLSITRLAKSYTNFVPILSPFGNELIKHKLREEQGAMHENQN